MSIQRNKGDGIRNEYGIYGEEAGLVISPLLLTQNDGNFHNPNVFIRYGTAPGTSEYIHVCYKTKPPVNPLPAKGNFWGNSNFGITSYDASPDNHIWLKTGTNAQPCTIAFSTNIGPQPITPPLEREPSACLGDHLTGSNPEDCALVATIPTTLDGTVRGKYRGGMDQIKAEQFTIAQTTFNELSAQWQMNMPNLNKFCQTLLQSSRSLATGQGFNQSDGQDRSQTRTITSSGLLLNPNPSSGWCWSNA